MHPIRLLSALILTGSPLQAQKLRELTPVWRTDFNSDASRIIVQTRGYKLGLWNTETGEPVPGDLGTLAAAGKYVVNGSGTRILAGFEKGGCRVFDLKDAHAVSPVLDATLDTVEPVSTRFSPDGAQVVIFTNQGECRIFEITTGRNLATLHFPPRPEDTEILSKIEFTKDGKSAFILDPSGKLHRYSTPAWTESVLSVTHADPKAYYQGFSISDDGKFAATFGAPGENGPTCTLQFWDLTASKLVGEPIPGKNGLSARFLPESHRALITPSRGTVRVLKVPTLEKDFNLPEHDDVEASRALASPDGRTIFTWGYDSSIVQNDALTGKITGSHSTRGAQVINVLTSPKPGIAWGVFDNTAFFSEHHFDFYVAKLDADFRSASVLRITDYLRRCTLSPDGTGLLILQGTTGHERVRLFNATDLAELPSTR